jgi:O-antigen/teichoic acid export membrane protein
MIQRLLKNDFNKNVLTLFTGTTIAQIIPIAITPILTRIYSPEEFGVFSLYMSIVMILSVLSTGRYELAIIIPKSDKDAINIAAFSLFVNIFMCFSILLFFLIGGKQLKKILGVNELGIWLYIIPVSLLLIGVYQIIYYWFNRKKMYRVMSNNKVTQQMGIGFSNIIIGFASRNGGLILGNVIGQFLALFLIGKKFLNKEKKILLEISKKEMLIQAKRYVDFPKYLTLAHTLNVSSSNLATIMFTSFFNTVVVGYFSLTQRILRFPLTIIGSAVSDVFRQKAADELIKFGNCKTLYLKTLFSLLFLGIIPFTILYILSPWLFSFIFGSEWKVAGEYARLMIPMLFLQFIISPLSSLFMVLEKQKLDLIWQIGLFLSTTVALVIGVLISRSIETSIVLFSAAYGVMYIINGLMTYNFAVKGNQSKKRLKRE